MWALFDHGDPNRAYWRTSFARWLTSPARDARWNVAHGQPAAAQSEERHPEFQQYVKEYPGADVIFANLANAKQPRPTVAGYVELSALRRQAIAQGAAGSAESQEALDEAAKQGRPGARGLR